jgi:hypothetical protein
MKEWLLMQTFYYQLIQKSHEQLDATAGGSFMSLTTGKAKVLMKKIATNQSWTTCNIQSCHKSEEVLEVKQDGCTDEFARTARQLQERSSSHSRCINAQNKCGEYLGVEFVESQEDINTIINNSAPQQ